MWGIWKSRLGLTLLGVERCSTETVSFSSVLHFLLPGRAVSESAVKFFVGDSLRCRFNGNDFNVPDCFCFENMAWMPSVRLETGSIKVADSVPTLPISLGT